ncbi:MAG TPA: SRPBCC family protein [Thermoanaerobaculia bacterium]
MKAALRFLAFCVVAVVVMAMVGAGLPQKHVVTRRKSFAASPERVWSALLSIRQLPVDRSDLRAVDQGVATAPPTAIEVIGSPVAITFETFRPPRLLVVRTTEPDVSYGGTWTFELELETAQITKLTVTEEAEVHGRLLRFAVRTFDLDDALVEGVFRAVKRKLVETPN